MPTLSEEYERTYAILKRDIEKHGPTVGTRIRFPRTYESNIRPPEDGFSVFHNDGYQVNFHVPKLKGFLRTDDTEKYLQDLGKAKKIVEMAVRLGAKEIKIFSGYVETNEKKGSRRSHGLLETGDIPYMRITDEYLFFYVPPETVKEEVRKSVLEFMDEVGRILELH